MNNFLTTFIHHIGDSCAAFWLEETLAEFARLLRYLGCLLGSSFLGSAMVNMAEVRTYARMGSYGVMGGASQYCKEGDRIL